MTIKKRPRLTIVIGIVRTTIMGFITAFKNANTTATSSAVKKLLSSILTPGSRNEDIKTASVEIINLIIKSIAVDFGAKIRI